MKQDEKNNVSSLETNIIIGILNNFESQGLTRIIE